MPSAPRFFARKTSAMPPGAEAAHDLELGDLLRRRGRASGDGLATVAAREGHSYVYTRVPRRCHGRTSHEPTRARPRAARSPRRRLVHLLLYAVEKKLGGTIELFAPDKRARSCSSWGRARQGAHERAVAYLGQVLRRARVHDEPRRSSRSLGRAGEATGAAARGSCTARSSRQGAVDRRRAAATRGWPSRSAASCATSPRCPRRPRTPTTTAFDVLRDWGGDRLRAASIPLPTLWSMLRESARAEHVNAALARVAGSACACARTAELVRARSRRGGGAPPSELLRQRPMRAAESSAEAASPEHDRAASSRICCS